MKEKIHPTLIKNSFLKPRKLILKLEKIYTQDFNFCSVGFALYNFFKFQGFSVYTVLFASFKASVFIVFLPEIKLSSLLVSQFKLN